jgi:hypothetical protein
MQPDCGPTQFVATTTPSPREGRPLRAGEGVAALSCLAHSYSPFPIPSPFVS